MTLLVFCSLLVLLLAAHQIAIKCGELPPKAILEIIQLAVKGHVACLCRQLGHAIACDALDVIVAHHVMAGHVVLVAVAEVALDDVFTARSAVGLEHHMVASAQH